MAEHSLIQIQEVVPLLSNDSELLWGFNIDTPNISYKTDKYEILFAGWILGKKAEVVSIEVMSDNQVIHTISINYPRPDVAQRYPEAVSANTSGFWSTVGVSELPLEVELVIQAVFSDRTCLPLSKIKVQKKLPFLEQVKLDLARSKTRLQQIQTELNTTTSTVAPSKLNVATSKKNDLLHNYAAHLSEEEWFEAILKSVEHSFINGIKMPGFPTDEIQVNSVGSAGKLALSEGFRFYSEIKHYAAKLGLSLTKDSRVLDFGCGWGRMIRVFLRDVLADNLYGIDVDPEMIDICVNTIHYGNYSVVQPEPPTGFPDNHFDVIYAYSVFSHLSEPVHIKWVQEFSKILKPGGIMVVTTQARRFIEFCRSLREQNHESGWYYGLAHSFKDTEAALADYDRGKYLFSATGGGAARPASFYGEAVIPPGYIKREWTKYLTFCDFVDDPAKFNQCYIVMQKPANAGL